AGSDINDIRTTRDLRARGGSRRGHAGCAAVGCSTAVTEIGVADTSLKSADGIIRSNRRGRIGAIGLAVIDRRKGQRRCIGKYITGTTLRDRSTVRRVPDRGVAAVEVAEGIGARRG